MQVANIQFIVKKILRISCKQRWPFQISDCSLNSAHWWKGGSEGFYGKKKAIAKNGNKKHLWPYVLST